MELDGLKPKPVAYKECLKEKWHEVAVPAIEERIQKYATDEISFNLLAVTNDKESVFRRELREAAESGDNENIAKLTEEIEDEMHRKENWKDENIRRKHNYIPFIFEMLKCIAENGRVRKWWDEAVDLVVISRSSVSFDSCCSYSHNTYTHMHA